MKGRSWKRCKLSRFDYKVLIPKTINRISLGLDAPGKALIFVFAFLGTKLYKDKVMGLTDQGSEGRLAAVPSVIFANWREVLNQARLSEPTRAGYALACKLPAMVVLALQEICFMTSSVWILKFFVARCRQLGA
jgi:hypothetical protein